MSIEDTAPDGFLDWPREAQRAWLMNQTSGTITEILRDELLDSSKDSVGYQDVIRKEERAMMVVSLAKMKG